MVAGGSSQLNANGGLRVGTWGGDDGGRVGHDLAAKVGSSPDRGYPATV